MHGILIFGDSITAGVGDKEHKGWAGRFTKWFEGQDKYNFVYNLGIPGETTSKLLKRFETECSVRTKHIYDDDRFIVIFNIGINDAKIIGSGKQPQISLSQFKNNLLSLINLAKKYTKEVVFIGLTSVDESKDGLLGDQHFFNENIRKYNIVIKEACKAERISFIDLFENWSANSSKDFLSEDGLHPNELGHKNIFELVREIAGGLQHEKAK